MQASMGNGNSENMASRKFTISIITEAITNKITVVMVYIMPGPRYMRTRLTSSVTRFIKSPVLLRR